MYFGDGSYNCGPVPPVLLINVLDHFLSALMLKIHINVRRLVTRIADTGLPFGGQWTYELVPDGEGTRLTITEDGEVYNPLFRFVSRFVMGHTATIERYLDDVEKRFPAVILSN